MYHTTRKATKGECATYAPVRIASFSTHDEAWTYAEQLNITNKFHSERPVYGVENDGGTTATVEVCDKHKEIYCIICTIKCADCNRAAQTCCIACDTEVCFACEDDKHRLCRGEPHAHCIVPDWTVCVYCYSRYDTGKGCINPECPAYSGVEQMKYQIVTQCEDCLLENEYPDTFTADPSCEFCPNSISQGAFNCGVRVCNYCLGV